MYALQLLYESWIPYADRLTIIVLSMPADWSSTLAPTFHDLPSSFGYRKPLVRNFDVYSIENALLDFAQRGRVRIHFVLVGELFGEHGYTFSDVFK